MDDYVEGGKQADDGATHASGSGTRLLVRLDTHRPSGKVTAVKSVPRERERQFRHFRGNSRAFYIYIQV